MSFLQTESSNGRKLILATASLKSNADEISKSFPFFDKIYGMEMINSKGVNKLKVLINEFGEFKFDYMGNSNSDLKIFASSRYSYLVNPTKSLGRKARKISNLK